MPNRPNTVKNNVKTKIVKDVVHQFVEFPSDFMATAIDNPLFQRLRDVKQLSLAHLVYPGATHTRFEHSLGVAHVMKTALRALSRNVREHLIPSLETYTGKGGKIGGLAIALKDYLLKIVEKLEEYEPIAITAALYHDIGHIALSHPGEVGLRDPLLFFSPDPNITLIRFQQERVDHERIGIEILAYIRNQGGIRYRGGIVDLDKVYQVLLRAYVDEAWNNNCGAVTFKLVEEKRNNKKKTLQDYTNKYVPEKKPGDIALCIIASLLSSPIDVDRADYTLRDSLHTGSRSGIWDIMRYYSVLTLVPRITASLSDGEYRVQIHVGVLDKGVSVIESMLLSRVYMYGDVYLHDISMIYSAIASRLISLLYSTARYLMWLADKGDSNAEKLLDKYGVLNALGNLNKLARAGIVEHGEIEEILSALTDSPVTDMIRMIATGRTRDVFDYLNNQWVDDEEKNEVRREWFKKSCISLVLGARAVLYRRHWQSLILSDARAVRIIKNLKRVPHELSEPEHQMLRESVDPLLIVHWANYIPYKGEGRDKVYVFRRRNPLAPRELEQCQESKVIDKLLGISYSKLLITIPRITSKIEGETQLHGWYVRGGKLTGMDYEATIKFCNINRKELNNILKESGKKAIILSSKLLEIS